MDKLRILCSMDNKMMSDFSKRVVERATGRALHNIHLPFINTYLKANVMKEVEKDRIIITHAVSSFTASAGPRQPDVDAIFEETKAVDRLFLKRLTIPSLTVDLRYEDIAEVRKGRIARLSNAIHTLLAAWSADAPFQDAVRAAFSASQFREALMEILHLYNLETRQVSHSTRFYHPFNTAINYFADTLFDIMETVSEDLARDYARQMYEGEPDHASA